MKVSKLPDTKFKPKIIRILKKLRGRMNEFSKNLMNSSLDEAEN